MTQFNAMQIEANKYINNRDILGLRQYLYTDNNDALSDLVCIIREWMGNPYPDNFETIGWLICNAKEILECDDSVYDAMAATNQICGSPYLLDLFNRQVVPLELLLKISHVSSCLAPILRAKLTDIHANMGTMEDLECLRQQVVDHLTGDDKESLLQEIFKVLIIRLRRS